MLNVPRFCIFFLLFPLLLLAQDTPTSAKLPLTGEQIIEKYQDRAKRLFDQIDFKLPIFSPIRDALESGNKGEALEKLLLYYRRTPTPPSLTPALPPARKDILELAEDATHDTFTIQSRTHHQSKLSNGGLDWDDRGPNNDKEWAWMMNRHQHFNYLLTAFVHTKKTKYLDTINDHLIDWIPSHPPPNHVTFSTSWRALEAARRIMDAWLAVFAYAKTEKAITDEALFLMLTSIPEHAVYLRDHHSFWGGNHKMTEKMAIAVCALGWPEFRESSAWLKGAIEITSEELFKQTYPDGSYKELANHYQKVVAENYLRLLSLLHENKASTVLPEFEQRIEAVWDYFAYVSRPSGFGPLNNDSSLEDNFTYLQEANQFFNRPDWTYILSWGSEGIKPQAPPSRYFPWAGHAIMRNGWGKSAHWAFFDMGPNGSAHQHADKLHLSISIGQYDLLVDSGRYIYKPGPMRTYFRSGLGHNTVRIDGQDSVRPPNTINAPLSNRASIQKGYDVFQSQVEFRTGMNGGKSVKQKRSVVYIRDLGWLVLDELIGYGEHRYDSNWNFHPDCVVTQNGESLAILLPDGSRAQLSLLTQKNGKWSLVRGQMAPEIRGWYSWAYNEKKATTSARYTYSAKQPHFNAWWIATETPFEEAAVVEIVGEMNDLSKAKIILSTHNRRIEVTRLGEEIMVKETN